MEKHMNKYPISTLFFLGLISAPHYANAAGDACSRVGITSGVRCSTIDFSGGITVMMDPSCYKNSIDMDEGMLSTCIARSCNGICVCTSKLCQQQEQQCTIPACITGITWGATLSSGVQVGLTTASSVSACKPCKDIPVYRCGEGYYLSKLGSFDTLEYDGEIYAASSINCIACPYASDDKNKPTIMDTPPSYATSTAGLNDINSCRVKANSSIQSTAGTYVYTANCGYSGS